MRLAPRRVGVLCFSGSVTEPATPSPYLELPDAATAGTHPVAPTQPSMQAPWLEAPVAAEAQEAQEVQSDPTRPQRRKVRAAERPGAVEGPSGVERDAIKVMAALQTDRPLLAALWPDLTPGELLRMPPPPAALQARCDSVRRAMDAVGRRDAEARARADVAQRRLAQELDRLSRGGAFDPNVVLPDALHELKAVQEREFVAAARLLAGPGATLYARDVSRLDAAAEAHGVDPAEARALCRRHGLTVTDLDAQPWSPFNALPGAPATLDAVADALLRHPVQGADLVRSGAVLEWMRANNASGEMIARARDARLLAERGQGNGLAVHAQAWDLGRRDLVLGPVVLRAPGEINLAVRNGSLGLDELARAAREGLLGAWLRRQGWVGAAGAADLVARGEASGMKRLAWSLGEPLVVGTASFSDPDTLCRAALASEALREPLVALYARGDLLAWLESLAPTLRDEQWIEQLRRASRAEPVADTLPLWMGLYTRARCSTLTLRRAGGGAVTLAAVSQLCITPDVATLWDGLKLAYRTGELQAWLSVVAPEIALPHAPRPPHDDEHELNTLLWALGHTGMVLEWGDHDLAVRSPGDLVRAYQTDWRRLEGLLVRGHVLAWLGRFHGATPLVPGEGHGAESTLGEFVKALDEETGKLPTGHAALKLALACGLKYLPLDPCEPGNDATCRGWYGVTLAPPGDPKAWAPLRGHFVHGAAMVWLAMLPRVRPQLARPILRSAFGAWNPAVDQGEYVTRVLAAVARDFGTPVASPALQAEMDRALGTPASRGVDRPAAAAAPSRWRWVLPLMLLLGLAGSAAAWWDYNYAQRDLPQQPGAAGTEVWVKLRVQFRASNAKPAQRWDIDGSAPELGALIQTRDEPLSVGPCASGHTCNAELDNVRLVPNGVFRVRVLEHDPGRVERLGELRMHWRGGRRETLTGTVGDVTVTVTLEKLAVQPAPIPTPAVPTVAPVDNQPAVPLVPAPSPRPTTSSTSRRSSSRVSTPAARSSRSRTRATNPDRVPDGQMQPLGMPPFFGMPQGGEE
jgi:hypothetical protein